jgi:hypothetical protein
MPSSAVSIAGKARRRASSELARHRNRAGQGGLDRAVGVGAQEFDIAQLDRPQPADRRQCSHST